MTLASNYRGRLSFKDALELDIHHFQTLRHMMYLETISKNTKEIQAQKSAEMIEDEIVERM